MNAERAVSFECEGQRLIGVVSGPQTGEKPGVLIVTGGPQYRVGCHRQFVLLARKLAHAGIPAMRFDYRGMGDSDGGTQTFHDTAPDIAAAIDAFQAACPGLDRIVLWGLCDGASASLMYWHDTADVRIAGIVLLNPWIISSDGELAQVQVTKSLQRVLTPAFWMKLVRGGIDIPGAARSFAEALRTMVSRGKGAEDGARPFQDRMAQAMETFPGPVLVLLSGEDLVSAEFLAYCEANPRWRELIGRSNVERGQIDEADHTFSGAAAREEVESRITQWVERSFARAES